MNHRGRGMLIGKAQNVCLTGAGRKGKHPLNMLFPKGLMLILPKEGDMILGTLLSQVTMTKGLVTVYILHTSQVRHKGKKKSLLD
jgi:hypothetical protein